MYTISLTKEKWEIWREVMQVSKPSLVEIIEAERRDRASLIKFSDNNRDRGLVVASKLYSFHKKVAGYPAPLYWGSNLLLQSASKKLERRNIFFGEKL